MGFGKGMHDPIQNKQGVVNPYVKLRVMIISMRSNEPEFGIRFSKLPINDFLRVEPVSGRSVFACWQHESTRRNRKTFRLLDLMIHFRSSTYKLIEDAQTCPGYTSYFGLDGCAYRRKIHERSAQSRRMRRCLREVTGTEGLSQKTIAD